MILLIFWLARSHAGSPPKEMARIVGVVRSASEVAPWGTFLSFNLQNSLTEAVQNIPATSLKTWYGKKRIYLSTVAVRTMEQLLETLLVEDGITWTRPMYLLFDRDPTHRVYSDASYIGLGGGVLISLSSGELLASAWWIMVLK